MHRYTANTVEGCLYSSLCVARLRPSKYSRAWDDDDVDADIVLNVVTLSRHYRVIMLGDVLLACFRSRLQDGG